MGTSQPDRRARLQAILDRDGYACVWCGRALGTGLTEATTEHLIPRVKGGPSWLENEVAACGRCNGQRGHMTLAQWAQECSRRGWQPDLNAIISAMEALQSRIQRVGGQRRARPYLASQLRRLRRMVEESDDAQRDG